MKIIDITKEYFQAEQYEGDPAPRLTFLNRIDRGDDYNLSLLEACLHTATHIDAPLHMFEQTCDVTDLPLEHFVGKCSVVEIDKPPVTGIEVNTYVPFDCKRILFKCRYGAYLHPSAAYELAQDGMLLVGTDNVTIGGEQDDLEVHKALLGYNVAILENLDLSQVKPGNYFLFAPPLKIAGAEGAPCRAVLLDQKH